MSWADGMTPAENLRDTATAMRARADEAEEEAADLESRAEHKRTTVKAYRQRAADFDEAADALELVDLGDLVSQAGREKR